MADLKSSYRVVRLLMFPLLVTAFGFVFYNILTSISLVTTRMKMDQRQNLYAQLKISSLFYAPQTNASTKSSAESSRNGKNKGVYLSRIQGLLHHLDEKFIKQDLFLKSEISRQMRDVKTPQSVRLRKSNREDITHWGGLFNRSLVRSPNFIRAPLPLVLPDPYIRPSVCPKTIASKAKYSQWFKERYRPRVKLFIDLDDVENQTNFNAQWHGMPFGFRGTTQNEMLKVLEFAKLTNPPVEKQKQCLRCAVVGNGGVLNGSFAGPEIDSHDYIFRLNVVKTEERFTQHIGKRTSFYLFYPESQRASDIIDPKTLFLFLPFKTSDITYFDHMIRGITPYNVTSRKGVTSLRHTAKLDPGRIKLIHPDFLRYVFFNYLNAQKARPTTGAILALLGVHLCDEVTIYGFGYDSRFTLHYYDSRFITHTDTLTGSHDVDNERHLWANLHEEGIVKLFKRDF